MKPISEWVKITCLILFIGLLRANLYSGSHIHRQPNWKDYSSFDTIVFDFKGLYTLVKSKTPTLITIDLKNWGVFKADVKPSNLYLKDAQVIMQYDEHKRQVLGNSFIQENQWMGRILGTKHDARLNIYADKLSGYINLDTAYIYFETVQLGGISKLFIYNSNSYHGHNEGTCGVKDTGIHIPIGSKRGLSYVAYECTILKITGVISFGLFKSKGYDTARAISEILDRMNISDGIYTNFLHIRIKLTALIISPDSMAVYNNSVYAGSCLSDFTNKLPSFSSILTPDVYHLFLEDFVSAEGYVGLSHLGSICNSNGASLSMSNGNLSMRSKIFCHEVGHNLNADHTDAINCSANGSIMCPTASNSTPYFGQKETNAISLFIYNKRNNSGTPAYCLKYPRYDYTRFLDLCTHDSALFIIKKDKDFYLTAFYYEDSLIRQQVEDTTLWIKRPGTYRLVHSIDTSTSLECSFNNEFFACGKDFKVTHTGESGIGSLKQALLNSNQCSGVDTITFQLPDSINYFYVNKLLPPLIDSCVIDGTTQPGYKAPNNKEKYQPSVVLLNKAPIGYDSNFGFVLSRESYLIKGLEINGFGYGILNYELNYKLHPYSPYYPTIYENNHTDLTMYANRLVNNERMITMYFLYDVIKDNYSRFGDGSLKNANFFLSNKANNYGVKIFYGKESVFDHNYFGIEAGTDSLSTCRYYISLSGCEKNTITRNHFGNTIYTSIESGGSGAIIRQNKFGFNPFNSTAFNMTGAALNSPINLNWPLEFGGPGANDGNLIFNNKCAPNLTYGRFGSISGATLNNFRVTGNMVINPDTTSILLLEEGSKPVKYLKLDSAHLNCKNNNSITVYGRVKTKFLKDTVYIHYYTVPKGVKSNYEPMHAYKGYFILDVPDSSGTIFFTHTIAGCASNEGLVATAITAKLQVNSQLSNAVYASKAASIFKPFVDTCLCPGQSIAYLHNANWDSITVNDKPVKSDTFINSNGVYKITAQDSNGCLYNQLLLLKIYPDYFKGVRISGPEKYKTGSTDTFSLVNYKNTQNWLNNNWFGYHANVKLSDKYSCMFELTDDTAIVSYRMMDINKCSYLIADTLLAENSGGIRSNTLANTLIIYPNPNKTGLFFLSIPAMENLYLYSADGRILKIFNQGEATGILDLGNYPSGIYFIRVGIKTYYKLVKE